MLRTSFRRYTVLVVLGPPVLLFYFLCFIQETQVLKTSSTRSESPELLIDDFWSQPPSSRSLQDFQEQSDQSQGSVQGSVRVIRQEWAPNAITDAAWFFDSSFIDSRKNHEHPIPDNVLLNMTTFKFLKDASHVCASSLNQSHSNHHQSHPLMIAFVHSAPNNFVKRSVIRSTWASTEVTRKLNVKVVFLLGLSNSSVIESLVTQESKDYLDIIQGNFIDSYKNLTYKHLTGLRWVSKFCNESFFVMKVDDDAFIDIFQVTKSLRRLLMHTTHTEKTSPVTSLTPFASSLQFNIKPSGLLACSLFPEGTAVKRQGKWALTQDEYPFESYPSYCSGIAYFMTPDVADRLFKAAHLPGIKVIWIDDVFVTGVLPAVIGLKHKSMGLKFTYDHDRLRSWSKRRDLKPNPYLVSDIGDAHDWQPLMKTLWEKTLRVLR